MGTLLNRAWKKTVWVRNGERLRKVFEHPVIEYSVSGCLMMNLTKLSKSGALLCVCFTLALCWSLWMAPAQIIFPDNITEAC